MPMTTTTTRVVTGALPAVTSVERRAFYRTRVISTRKRCRLAVVVFVAQSICSMLSVRDCYKSKTAFARHVPFFLILYIRKQSNFKNSICKKD